MSEARREAGDWFVRLQSDDAGDEDWRAFELWLTSSDAHEAAFREVEAVWVDLDAARPAAQTAQIIPLPVRPRVRRRAWRLPAAIAASVTGLLAVAGLMTLSTQRLPAAATTSSTADRTLAIPGGGLIQVKAGTPFGLQRHGAQLEALMGPGRAAFTVVHDPARTFVVRAGEETITDIGTRFDIRRDTGGIDVLVTDGEVAVADRDPAHNVLTVRAGQAATRRGADDGARLRTASGAPLQRVYADAPLSQVVADLNQTYARPVRLAPNAAGLRFTGALVMDGQEGVLRRLASFMDLDVSRSSTAILLSRAAKTGR